MAPTTNPPGDEKPASSGVPITTPTGERVELHSAAQNLQFDEENLTPPDGDA